MHPLAGRAVVLAVLVVATLVVSAQADLIPTTPGLQGYWRLDEAAGSATVTDASPNGFSGTVVGGVTLGQASAMPSLGTCAVFDGSTGKIDVPYHAAINPPEFTIEAFARVDGGAGSYRSPLTARDGTPGQEGFPSFTRPAITIGSTGLGRGGM